MLAEDGRLIQSATTDSCGAFQVAADETSTIRISPVGFQPIELSASVSSEDALVSALPPGAGIEITSLQYLGERQLSVLVVDSMSKKAVLGVQPAAYAVTADGADVPVESISSQGIAVNAQPFSTALVLDASSSMSGCAVNCPGAGSDPAQPRLNRYQMATRAAHEFINGKKASDEVALTYFSTNVFRLADEFFVDRFLTPGNEPTGYAYSTDGFSTDGARLRLPIDHYNPYSVLWRTGGDPMHPDSAAQGLRVNGRYPYSGNTALFSAATDGVERVRDRANARKIVVAMTDGGNNAGSANLQTTIAAANAANVPIYTVGFGIDANSTSRTTTDVKDLALKTGADFAFVDGADLVGLFAGLQTAIRFETTLLLGRDLTAGQTVALTLSVPGSAGVSREIVIAP